MGSAGATKVSPEEKTPTYRNLREIYEETQPALVVIQVAEKDANTI